MAVWTDQALCVGLQPWAVWSRLAWLWRLPSVPLTGALHFEGCAGTWCPSESPLDPPTCAFLNKWAVWVSCP